MVANFSVGDLDDVLIVNGREEEEDERERRLETTNLPTPPEAPMTRMRDIDNKEEENGEMFVVNNNNDTFKLFYTHGKT